MPCTFSMISDTSSCSTRQRKMIFLCSVLIACLLFSSSRISAQQIPDTLYNFPIHQPAYQNGKGPVIMIDAAHHNFHTRNGGFLPFARLLEQDGYQVKSLDKIFTGNGLPKSCKILVIVNALNAVNEEMWALPTPSAFTKDEIARVKKWVEDGGNLFLVADHMPFAGAATDLAKAFGFEFINGFARTGDNFWPPSVFSLRQGNLSESVITKGVKPNEKIDSVATFTGSAFKSPAGAITVLNFKEGDISLQPDTAWRIKKDTPTRNLQGFQQGAAVSFGKGKVAVFGEAAMFTAQIVNGTARVGLSSPYAPQNAQFVLNLIHWLDGVSIYSGTTK